MPFQFLEDIGGHIFKSHDINGADKTSNKNLELMFQAFSGIPERSLSSIGLIVTKLRSSLKDAFCILRDFYMSKKYPKKLLRYFVVHFA